jgi:23S rRNA (cytidine1920-2'-O)/16S rRNA (cytidine1409-2'-O)-methyltransferase
MARLRPLADLAAAALAPLSREQVVARILCGEVLVDGERVRDPKRLLRESCAIVLRERHGFVSRAGDKLDHAVRAWSLPVTGGVFVDAGCSTGGFTDCLLAHGATRVYAVDVGRNQLDYRLRTDPRVVVLEGVNVMSLTGEALAPRPAAVVADLSFRSLRGAAGHLLSLGLDGWMVALAKPQFEWSRAPASFDGVVRDKPVVAKVLSELVIDLWREGARLGRAVVSPVRGRRGNVEVLLELRRSVAGDVDGAVSRLLSALDELLA